jgi:hypothetical protein
LAGGDSLLFEPDFIPEGNRRLSKSVLVAEDRSIKDGSVGNVSGEPLFVPDERRDEPSVERPREETELVSVSGGTEEPGARFATGCTISVAERWRWDGATAGAGDDVRLSEMGADVGAEDDRLRMLEPTTAARLLNVRCCGDIHFASWPGEKLPVLFTERGRLSAETSEREESPDGDRDRDKVCGGIDLTDSLERAWGLNSWTEEEEGEERGSDWWFRGIQACTLSRVTPAAHGDIATKVDLSTSIDAPYESAPSIPCG